MKKKKVSNNEKEKNIILSDSVINGLLVILGGDITCPSICGL